jgi:hypothetical protein
MLKNLFFLLLIFLSGKMNSQTICDSVSIDPDTIYISQLTDTTVTTDIIYTGQRDISYSACSFIFADTTHIKISDYVYTNGVSGPFILTATWYKLVYKNPNIPANTVVTAQFRIDHGPQIIDCYLPVTFIINSTIDIKEFSDEVQFQAFPNPGYDLVKVRTKDGGYDISVFDLQGRKISDHRAKSAESVIDLSGSGPGVYLIVLRKGNQITTRKIVKAGQ